MLVSPTEAKTWVEKRLPDWAVAPFNLSMSIAGWIIIIETTISIVTGRQFLRDAFGALVDVMPTFFAQILQLIGLVLIVLAAAWHQLTYPIIDAISAVTGFDLPLWVIDLFIAYYFLFSTHFRTQRLEREINGLLDRAIENISDDLQPEIDPNQRELIRETISQRYGNLTDKDKERLNVSVSDFVRAETIAHLKAVERGGVYPQLRNLPKEIVNHVEERSKEVELQLSRVKDKQLSERKFVEFLKFLSLSLFFVLMFDFAYIAYLEWNYIEIGR